MIKLYSMDTENKNIFGMIFFALSIIILGYMLFSPLTQLITHVDEFFTMTVVNFPVSEILHITTGDYNPPLYYLISKLAVKILTVFGINYLSILKLVSILPYLIILIISAVKLRNEYGWFTSGLFALSIGVMGSFFIYFITARMFSWAMLFLVLAFISFKDIITKDDMKSWILFTLFAILGSYTHYYAAISAAILYLLLLYHCLSNSEKGIKMWAISIGIAIISYLPWSLSLFHQMQAISTSSWFAPVDLGLIFSTFGCFASNGDVFFSIIAAVILIIIGSIYYRQCDSSDEDRFYILSGIIVFILTILIGIILSLILKPMLHIRFLIPACAVLWLAISIMVNKINRDRFFLISFALIVLLIIAGVGNMITAEHYTGVIDEITQDDSSIVILTNPKSMIYFLNLDNQTDLYCINSSYVYGENINLVHKIFDFKDITQNEISDLALNNTDKNIYLITWGDSDAYSNITTDSLLEDNGLEILKINTENLTPKEDENYYY